MKASTSSLTSTLPSRWCGLGLAFLTLLWNACAAETSAPADGNGAYATRQYRNLFAELAKSPRAIRHKMDAAFQQMFHGDPQSQAVCFSAGTNQHGALAFIYDAAPGSLLQSSGKHLSSAVKTATTTTTACFTSSRCFYDFTPTTPQVRLH